LNGAATVGGPLTVNGVSTFNGNVRITSVCAAWAGVSQPATFVCADSSGTPQGGVEYIPALASFSLFNSVGGANLQLGTANNLLFSGATASKPGGGAWADSSDARIKTVESDYKAGLAEVVSLRPVWFRYRGNDAPPDQPSPHAATMGRPFVGLIAQEAETVLPELVSAGPGFVDGQPVDDLRSLDPSALIYALVNAVKTLADRLAALEGGAPACPA
jgi:hypothetical protein